MCTASYGTLPLSCLSASIGPAARELHVSDSVYEQTLADAIAFEGIGLHTGEPVRLRILPAPPGKGIIFRRVDLENFEIRADVTSVARVAYATTLMSQGVWISTVEHVLSALYGSGVDNAYVELDNLEVPILEGSAQPFTEAIGRVGLLRQDRLRSYLRIKREFAVEENGKSLRILPSTTFAVKYTIDFPHPQVGLQELELECTSSAYAASIAPARTFGFYDQIEQLRDSGLIRGGSLDNAIILTHNGLLNDTFLRFPDEFVRHKILDLLGDFALVGKPVLGRLVAERAGHALHTRFVSELLESRSHWIVESRREPQASSRTSRRVQPAAGSPSQKSGSPGEEFVVECPVPKITILSFGAQGHRILGVDEESMLFQCEEERRRRWCLPSQPFGPMGVAGISPPRRLDASASRRATPCSSFNQAGESA